jgi:hypothetical protein
MPVGDQQRIITEIVATVLDEPAQTDISFDWFINMHTKQHFKDFYPAIEAIFKSLNGDLAANQSKRTMPLDCDAYFGGKYNFIFEFDEFQHFSSSRLKTLGLYPSNVRVSFDLQSYKQLCQTHRNDADRYRHSKKTKDFNFEGGRTAQRAYLDCFRDFLPLLNGLAPTVRISEFEVGTVLANNDASRNLFKQLLDSKLNGSRQS